MSFIESKALRLHERPEICIWAYVWRHKWSWHPDSWGDVTSQCLTMLRKFPGQNIPGGSYEKEVFLFPSLDAHSISPRQVQWALICFSDGWYIYLSMRLYLWLTNSSLHPVTGCCCFWMGEERSGSNTTLQWLFEARACIISTISIFCGSTHSTLQSQAHPLIWTCLTHRSINWRKHLCTAIPVPQGRAAQLYSVFQLPSAQSCCQDSGARPIAPATRLGVQAGACSSEFPSAILHWLFEKVKATNPNSFQV